MKAAIVYLIRGNEASLNSLRESLRLLKKNFLPWSPADVFVFHEDNVTASEIQAQAEDLKIECPLVDFSGIPSGCEQLSAGQRGYRHMCQFFANEIFLRSELVPYDYYMRLDDDSFILSSVRYNVFERMRQRGYKYAYRVIQPDDPAFCRGIRDVAVQTVRARGGAVREVEKIKENTIYYTNFEICDLAWFRSAPWQDFAAAIFKAGGIWTTRWGDAPIRYVGVNALLSPREIWCFRWFRYRHQREWLKGWTVRTPFQILRSLLSQYSAVLV